MKAHHAKMHNAPLLPVSLTLPLQSENNLPDMNALLLARVLPAKTLPYNSDSKIFLKVGLPLNQCGVVLVIRSRNASR